MLPDHYINATLVPYHDKDDIPEERITILIFSSEEQLEKVSFREVLKEKIRAVFRKGTRMLSLVCSDQKTILAVLDSGNPEEWRQMGADIYRKLSKENSLGVHLKGLKPLDDICRTALLEGILLGSYYFDKYKKEQRRESISVHFDERHVPARKVEELTNVVHAVALARTLVNEPVNFLDAVRFSDIAKKVGATYGFVAEILGKEQIQELGMGGLLAVNKGSETPPTFNVFHYKPSSTVNTKPLVLVGKGVMFDTGGYSIKTGGNMSTMKCDMAGGAAVLATLVAVSVNRLPYHVIGIVPATDNKISSNALVVDDIITMMDGSTVEVQNTDAEGRLVLADALTYAKRFEPELVIDMATLTGASAAITGPFGIAMAGNCEDQMQRLGKSGEIVYERVFNLPFWKEFGDLLKSDIADLKNIGGPVGGATTAAKFLERFTDYPWIHLDIAGMAFLKERKGYKSSGGTGVPVRMLYDFIAQRAMV